MPSRPWFTIDQIAADSFILSEYRHWEETHCYLLCGKDRALLIDTGLGICNIYAEVRRLTGLPITAVATHIHWDHIGGHWYFPDFYAHSAELDWLSGHFPLRLDAVREMVLDRCDPPEDFDVSAYQLFQGTPTRVLTDGDCIDLGGRVLQVLHTPGHSPGHMCFWEKARGWLFTGDLVYLGTWSIWIRSLPTTPPPIRRRIWPLWKRPPLSLSGGSFPPTTLWTSIPRYCPGCGTPFER